jgi:hypothetical protein
MVFHGLERIGAPAFPICHLPLGFFFADSVALLDAPD